MVEYTDDFKSENFNIRIIKLAIPLDLNFYIILYSNILISALIFACIKNAFLPRNVSPDEHFSLLNIVI